jgi:FKBP-type peptidyl-prolyl cis-trans isomerase FklB
MRMLRARSSRRLAAGAIALALAGCRSAPSGAPELRTPEERFSYSLGARLGGEVRRSRNQVDHALAERGFEDGLAGRAVLSDAEIATALEEGVKQRQQQLAALDEQRARAAAEEGQAFLAKNRERPEVKLLDSGVQVEVLEAGSGPVPGSEDFVTCHYRGTLLDGTVFDDTAKLGRPRTFAVTSVIEGFEQALEQMPAGSRWKIYVPAELAYGARGAGPIPPNSTLVFEVELVSVQPAPAR